ncbi:hypothetical protein NQ315_014515 [Exocentrus adspersus]|uniref:Triokinase/FMN cyclase n=1 Tax=Exocentrus adspersus TaxID=1586481 RepID=A0AAV8V9Z9_9CUCU|nr:hypothetical protein NQ315_014515 [Exocentrus adspersus]
MDCKIIEVSNTTTEDCLKGLTCANEEIALFDFGNVVVQKDYSQNVSVRIISGGSNFFGEYVGRGMLTASIQGEGSLAPTSKVVLRTIRELSLNHVNGSLIIVPANTGDLLNFGVATERALNDKIQVKLLAVGDNFDNKLPRIHRYGLSGVVLVHKIAGNLSEEGKSLNEIYSFCEQVVKNIVSFEIISSDFDKNKDDTINKLSKGGAKKIFAKKIITHIYNQHPVESEQIIDEKFCLKTQDRIILLLNNNGGMGKSEEYMLFKKLLSVLEQLDIVVERFYTGSFLKCNQKVEVTLTILKNFDPQVLISLDDSCRAPGWREAYQHSSLSFTNPLTGNLRRRDRLTPPIRGPKLSNREANVLLLSTHFACDALISCEQQLNAIDSGVGDGDAGTRLKYAALVLLKRMNADKLVSNYPFTFFESLSKLLEATVGGTAGCIYSILFEAAGNCFGNFCEYDEVTPFMWLKSLEAAGRALKRYGNVDFGEGTMYDPIYICGETVRLELEAGKHYIEAFGKGVAAAEEIAQKTKKRKQKYPDSGAHAVGIWMRAVVEGVKLRCPIE